MSSVNKAIIVGRLGQNPEIRFGQPGMPLCTFSVATTKSWSDKDGVRQERTFWHRIVVWGKQADPCGEYLSKGSLVYVEGEIETRKFEDKDGAAKFITEIRAQNVRFLEGKKSQQERIQPEINKGYGDAEAYGDRDVPF